MIVIMLSVVILSVVMLSVVMLSVVILSVVAPFFVMVSKLRSKVLWGLSGCNGEMEKVRLCERGERGEERERESKLSQWKRKSRREDLNLEK